MSSHNHNRASQATEIQTQLHDITRKSSLQGGPSHVPLSNRIPTGPASRKPSHGPRQHRAIQPSTRRPSLLRHRGVLAQIRFSTYRARLNGHRNRVGHAPPALNQSLSQNNDQNQPNYPSSSLHDPYHGNDFEQSQPTHSKYPPHAGGFDYDPVRRYQTLDGNFPVPLFQNHNTALLVQPTRYEVQHQQPQQNYENGSSQLQDSGTNGSQERSSVKKRTMPNVPPGLPIEDPFIANPELMGAGIYNRGVDVSGFPPPLLPYDKSFLPLPAGSAGTHHGRALDMGFSNRYHPYPLGTHRNYGGGMMGREANGYLPPPRGAGYPVNMNGCDKKEGKNGNKYHPPLQEARPSHGLDPKGYGNGGMNQDGYYPHPQGAFPNHGVGPNGYDIEGMNQNGYYAHRPVVHPSYGVGPIGYDHGGTNYIGFYPHPPDAPGPAFHEGMGNMALSDSLQPRANSNLGGDGGAEQYGNHQMSNNIVVGLRHQESRALLYDPEVPLPSIETDEYQEWANLRQQLRDPYAADFDQFLNSD